MITAIGTRLEMAPLIISKSLKGDNLIAAKMFPNTDTETQEQGCALRRKMGPTPIVILQKPPVSLDNLLALKTTEEITVSNIYHCT